MWGGGGGVQKKASVMIVNKGESHTNTLFRKKNGCHRVEVSLEGRGDHARAPYNKKTKEGGQKTKTPSSLKKATKENTGRTATE